MTTAKFQEIVALVTQFGKLTITEDDDPTLSSMLDEASGIVSQAMELAGALLVSAREQTR